MFEEDYSRYRLFPLFLTGVAFVIASPLFWLHGEAPTQSLISRGAENVDLYNRSLPYFSFAFERLRQGELPLWSNAQWCGIPFMADPLTGIFQPLYILFYLLPADQAMATTSFAGLALMGIFFVLFARSLDLRYTSSIAGAVVFAFCGITAAAMTHPENMATLAWTPLLFWGIREHAREGQRAPLVIGALALAFCLLAGIPALALPFGIIAILYYLIHNLVPLRGKTIRLSRVAMDLALFLGVATGAAAVQWLPSAFWLFNLADPASALWRFSLAGAFPQDWNEMAGQLVLAKSGALTPVYYLGIVALLTLPPSLFHRTARLECLFMLLLLPLLLLMVWRGSGAGSAFPYAALLFPAGFAAAVLVALGTDRLFVDSRDPRSVFIWFPVLLFLASTAFLLYAGSGKARGLLLVALCITLPYFIFRAGWLRRVCGALFIACLFLDLLLATKNYYAHPYLDRSALPNQAPLRTAPPPDEPEYEGKSLTLAHEFNAGFQQNDGLMTLRPAADGTGIPVSRWQQPWMELIQRHRAAQDISPYQDDPATSSEFQRALALAGVTTLRIAADHPFATSAWYLNQLGYRLQQRNEYGQIWVSDVDFPRAWLATGWRVAASPPEGLKGALAPEFPWQTACFVDSDSPGFEALAQQVPQDPVPGVAPAGPRTVCTVQQANQESIGISLNAPQPGIVVVADAYYPGWHAELDGSPVPILCVNGLLRGIAVGAGEHTLQLRYVPRAFQTGFAISFSTIAALALWGLATLWRSALRTR
ncbi:MAG: YfhO family protein [Candidatus Hydrogenedentes bacterium]|nr:YfhO family protein [Candidatus Hydrogenedentota bacterium]